MSGRTLWIHALIFCGVPSWRSELMVVPAGMKIPGTNPSHPQLSVSEISNYRLHSLTWDDSIVCCCLLRNATILLDNFINAISVASLVAVRGLPLRCLSFRLSCPRFASRTRAAQRRTELMSTQSSAQPPVNVNRCKVFCSQNLNHCTVFISRWHHLLILRHFHGCNSETSRGKTMKLHKKLLQIVIEWVQRFLNSLARPPWWVNFGARKTIYYLSCNKYLLWKTVTTFHFAERFF
jgi:hypothetical protein